MLRKGRRQTNPLRFCRLSCFMLPCHQTNTGLLSCPEQINKLLSEGLVLNATSSFSQNHQTQLSSTNLAQTPLWELTQTGLFVGKTLVFLGKTLVFLGKTMVFLGKTMVFLGKTMVFLGKTMVFPPRFTSFFFFPPLHWAHALDAQIPSAWPRDESARRNVGPRPSGSS